MRSSGNAGVQVHEGVKGKEQSAANRAARQSRYTETGEEPVGGRELFVLGRGEHRRSRRNDASEARGGGRNRMGEGREEQGGRNKYRPRRRCIHVVHVEEQMTAYLDSMVCLSGRIYCMNYGGARAGLAYG